ncbi:MAG: hypothetical protein IPJ79_09400 [Bacteroidetes bacterium]|nr:hypothetical protein [Bacteroidota bacterium]
MQNSATSNTFNANSNGTYYVVESSSCGTSQSNSIVVTQINNPNPSISFLLLYLFVLRVVWC